MDWGTLLLFVVLIFAVIGVLIFAKHFSYDENKNNLSRILENYDDKQRRDKISSEKSYKKYIVFESKYQKIANQMIIPTMLEIGKAIRSSGHDFRIFHNKEGDYRTLAGIDRVIDLISFEFYKDSNKRNRESYVEFSRDPNNEIIYMVWTGQNLKKFTVNNFIKQDIEDCITTVIRKAL